MLQPLSLSSMAGLSFFALVQLMTKSMTAPFLQGAPQNFYNLTEASIGNRGDIGQTMFQWGM